MLKFAVAVLVSCLAVLSFANQGIYTDADRSYYGFNESPDVDVPFTDQVYVCGNIGEVGGCSACEATTGNCAWMDTLGPNYYPQCVPMSWLDAGGYIHQRNEDYDLEDRYRHAPEECPEDPAKAVRLAIKTEGSDNNYEAAHRQEVFPLSFDNGNNGFCEFPYEPYVVDRLTYSTFQGDLYNPDIRLTRGNANMCLQSQYAMAISNTRENEGNIINQVNTKWPRNKEELIASWDEWCIGPNPYFSQKGLECIRRMQAAQCSLNCPEYGRPRGFFCDSARESLYQICSDWTEGWKYYSGRPDQNGCPLDPSNLFWDWTGSAYCDTNLTRIRPSQHFEVAFGLYEPLEKDIN